MQQFKYPEKKESVSATMQAKPAAHAAKGSYLQDNRPQSVLQRQVFQLQSAAPDGTVMQLARTKTTGKRKSVARARTGKTISGHGKLRRGGKLNKIKMFTVPKGKTVMRPAPPGATLGNLSMILNKQKGLTRDELVKLSKVSTTTDLWNNHTVVRIIQSNAKIPKTKKQGEVINKLLTNVPYKDLGTGEKNSLNFLEKKKEFEQWSHDHVMDKSFQTFGEGEKMEDMEMTPFESKLKSTTPHSENEYVNNKTVLSNYVRSTGSDDFTVNACSWDENCDYTGFQIDHKK